MVPREMTGSEAVARGRRRWVYSVEKLGPLVRCSQKRQFP